MDRPVLKLERQRNGARRRRVVVDRITPGRAAPRRCSRQQVHPSIQSPDRLAVCHERLWPKDHACRGTRRRGRPARKATAVVRRPGRALLGGGGVTGDPRLLLRGAETAGGITVGDAAVYIRKKKKYRYNVACHNRRLKSITAIIMVTEASTWFPTTVNKRAQYFSCKDLMSQATV
jgi:hypothetical protein